MKFEDFKFIKEAKEYSHAIIESIRTELENELNIDVVNFTIVATGSFARGEASKTSDLDYFIIVDSDNIDDKNFIKGAKVKEDFNKKINNIISKYIHKEVGNTGTFGIEAVVTIDSLLTNIGGKNDNNIQFTRRMLFLLEGKFLYNKELFQAYRKKLIEKYIKDTVSDHHLSRFFLNDIIRFYRTMTTDFEYKVSEDGKSWGVRNIKLTFSRKILYFGGIITIAETAQKTRKTKIEETLKLLDMSPLERIRYVGGVGSEKIFKLYDYFLEKLSDEDIRDELDRAKIENNPMKNPEIFREMKNQSKHFSWLLSLLLKNTYDSSHPIHHALIF